MAQMRKAMTANAALTTRGAASTTSTGPCTFPLLSPACLCSSSSPCTLHACRRGRCHARRLFKRPGVGRCESGGHIPRGLLLGDDAGDQYAGQFRIAARTIGSIMTRTRSLLENGAREDVVSGRAKKEWYKD